MRSATSGYWEMGVNGGEVTEQLIRLTAVIDSLVDVSPTGCQVVGLLGEISDWAAQNQQVWLPASSSG